MSRFARLLLALLASMGLLFLWGGTASADTTTPTAEQCASETPPDGCPAPGGDASGGGDMATPPADPAGAGDPAGDGSGGGTDATQPGDSTQPTQPDNSGAADSTGSGGQASGEGTAGTARAAQVAPAVVGNCDITDPSTCIPGCDPSDPSTCIPGCDPSDPATCIPGCDPSDPATCIPGCDPSDPATCIPGCDPSDPATCIPGCDPSDPATCIPGCDPSSPEELAKCLPPCETKDDLPFCIPDCAFLAGLLGQDGCPEPPGCLPLPDQLAAVIAQLPKQITENLPICAPTTGGTPGGGGSPPPVVTPVDNSPGVYYENCDAAREAGAAPINRGEPGYRPELDRDSDGVACEDDTVNAAPVVDTNQLAYTGTDPKPMLAAGGGLLLLGAGLLRLGRRRS